MQKFRNFEFSYQANVAVQTKTLAVPSLNTFSTKLRSLRSIPAWWMANLLWNIKVKSKLIKNRKKTYPSLKRSTKCLFLDLLTDFIASPQFESSSALNRWSWFFNCACSLSIYIEWKLIYNNLNRTWTKQNKMYLSCFKRSITSVNENHNLMALLDHSGNFLITYKVHLLHLFHRVHFFNTDKGLG